MMKLPSLDLSMESKGKNVDVSLNVSGTPRCDEASSSGYSDLPKRSEGQDVGAPRCDEPPSSSSSSGPTSDPIRSILKDKVEDVNPDDLWKHIFERWKLREKGNHKQPPSLGPGLQKFKELVSFGTGLPIEDRYGAIREEIRMVDLGTLAPLVVVLTLESLDARITNRETFWHLIKEMYDLAIVLKGLSESPEGMQDVMQEATSLIMEGALVCSTQIVRSRFSFLVSQCEIALSEMRQKLHTMSTRINIHITVRDFTLIQHQRRSHLSKEYPTHAVEVKDGNLDRLWEHISELWEHIYVLRKPREKGNHEQPPSLGHFPWPDVPGWRKLKEIVLFGTDPRIKDIHGTVKALLKDIGRVNVATAAALVVAHTLESLDARITKKEFWHLATVLKGLSESPEEMQDVMQDVMQEATSLIIEGAFVFSLHGGRRGYFISASKCKEDINDCKEDINEIRQKLNAMYMHINTEITVRVSTLIQHQPRSHLSKEYPTHADNGQVEEDLLLTVQQEVDINTGQVEEDPLGPEPPNDEQVEEDLPVPELQEVDINTGQVEEDPLVPEPPNDEQVEEDLLSSGRLKVFKMEALVDATNNFHEDNKVGQGGFAAVYKGTTHHGKQIAVKKMSFTDERSREVMKKQFENEKLLAEIRHRNLVNLFGSCEQESQGFLVYEYLPNGSLDKWLSDPEKRKRLDWHKRFNIIEGIAQGLVYLHRHSQFRLFHRDIKASNILLDEKLNPKITDFGTAKPFPEDRSHVTATTIVGTRGYLAPEYAMGGDITVKVDVYSFGVVLLELLTGKLILNNVTEYLEWVWSSYNQNKVADTIDRTITETWDKEKGKAKAKAKALRCFQVALLCIQNDAKLRPTMSRVITMLLSFESLPVPTKPPLVSSPKLSFLDSILQRRGGK